MKIIIFTDGGSRGNPGPAGIGAVIKSSKGEIIKKYGEAIGSATNNEAEYKAAILGLKKIKQIFGRKKSSEINIEIRSDSELLVKQNLGEFKILEEKLQPLFIELWNLKQDFKSVNFKLISRQENFEADKLVNEALDEKKTITLGI